MVVSEDFFSPTVTYNYSGTRNPNWSGGYSYVSSSVLDTMHELAVNGSLVNYTSTNCIEAYSSTFVSKVRNVLLVTSHKNTNNNSLIGAGSWSEYNEVPYYWICGTSGVVGFWSENPYRDGEPVCTLSTAISGASDWTLSTYPISYCMVEEVVEKCQLSFSLAIMVVVIIANAGKATISR